MKAHAKSVAALDPVVATIAGPSAARTIGAKPHDELLSRIRGEYNEMPGLALSIGQAQRLWNLPHDDCERLLDELVANGFLSCTRFGMFVRADVGPAGA